MSLPRVSVLMAAYNAMPYLPTAVESVLRQTLKDYEFIIVDDGSSDGTPDYLALLDDPRVRVISQNNLGLAAALNRGLQECRAEYVARMDADDFSLPERLERMAEFLDANPQIGCLGCQTAPFGAARIGSSLKLPSTHEEVCLALEEGRHAMVHPSVMMRTSLLRHIGGYWGLRACGEEYDLFLRMSEVTQLANIGPVLHHMRFHMESMNGRGMKKMRRGIDYARRLAERRRAGQQPPDYEEFIQELDRAPVHLRLAEAIDACARSSYRAGIGDMYGRRRLRGGIKVALAAALAPQLTLQRITRMLGGGHRTAQS